MVKGGIWLASPEAWVALATLTALEMVLGIDNIIFISILAGRLPEHQRKFARSVGLGQAMNFSIKKGLICEAFFYSMTRPE